MWNSILEEPQHKKKKMSPSSSLSSLPDEIVLSCVSRVSRSDQPALSMVSKSYRSLVASPEIYKTRKLDGYTENCTYVCLRTLPDRIPRWFILSRGKLSPIPSSSSQAEEGSAVVVLGWGIYVIGGLIKRERTSNVLLLDCRTHTWHELPSMALPRSSPVAGVIGGKIYVIGGRVFSPEWAECFDPDTQTWVTLPPFPDPDSRGGRYTHSSVVVRDEKVYAVDIAETTFYYSPSEGKWGRGSTSNMKGSRRDWCVIGKIIYTCDRFGNLCWCEIEQLERQGEEMMNWRKILCGSTMRSPWVTPNSPSFLMFRDTDSATLVPTLWSSGTSSRKIFGMIIRKFGVQRSPWRGATDPRFGVVSSGLILS